MASGSQDVRIRFLQLTRSRLHPSPHFQLDLDTDFLPDDEAAKVFAARQIQEADTLDLTSRSHFTNPLQICNIEGLLEITASTGSLHLGEIFRGLISIANCAQYPIGTLHCKIELDSARAKAVLVDTTSAAAVNLAVGGQHEFVVRHDIKDVGQHLLTCQVVYLDHAGEQQSSALQYSFQTENPLSVRTKSRTIANQVLLEATIENVSKVPMIVDYIRLDAAEHYTSEPVEPISNSQEPSQDAQWNINDIQMIEASGGSLNVVFRLHAKGEKSERRSMEVLGKLDIKWRGSMGESGRLQTQPIRMTPTLHKDIKLQVLQMEGHIQAETPFNVLLGVSSNADRRIRGLSIRCKEESSGDVLLLGPTIQSIPEVAANGDAQIGMQFLPRKAGAVKLPQLETLEMRSPLPLDTLEVPIYVHPSPSEPFQ